MSKCRLAAARGTPAWHLEGSTCTLCSRTGSRMGKAALHPGMKSLRSYSIPLGTAQPGRASLLCHGEEGAQGASAAGWALLPPLRACRPPRHGGAVGPSLATEEPSSPPRRRRPPQLAEEPLLHSRVAGCQHASEGGRSGSPKPPRRGGRSAEQPGLEGRSRRRHRGRGGNVSPGWGCVCFPARFQSTPPR